jgi:hypothetical protein
MPYMELENQADDCVIKDDLIKAQYLYADAVKNATKQSATRSDMARLKKKMVSVTKKAVSTKGKYYKEIAFEHKYSKEEKSYINKVRKIILDQPTLTDVFQNIALGGVFHVNYLKLCEDASASLPIHSVLASNSVISKEGHTLEGGADGSFSWQMRMYGLYYSIIMQDHLGRIFYLLLQDNKITYEETIKHFKTAGILPTEVLKIIDVGIERFFAKDYVSFLHIFVPQFEGIFLRISDSLDICTIALERTEEVYTKTRTLSSKALISDEFTKVWGIDFCWEINYLMYETLGIRLRHKIAHGEISYDECSFVNAIRVLMLYLVMFNKVKLKI